MSQNIIIWKYQAVLLLRNRFLLAGLLFLAVAGLFSAWYGQHFVDQQQQMIYSVDTLQERQAQNAIAYLKELDTIQRTAEQQMQYETSGKYYRTGVAGTKTVVYRPGPFTSLSIGQKDNFPFYHEVTGNFRPADIYSITSTDIQNPVKLMAGNFDLSFVIIYLLPLFIIALGYNVLSGEKENSTYVLLRVQGEIKTVLRNKLAFQATLLILLSLVINTGAFWLNGISFGEQGVQMLSWHSITVVYILFWFAIVYLIASLNLPSATNALLLGGIWILLLLLMPSLVHRHVSGSHEKELAQTMFNARGDLPEARKMEPAALADSFSRLEHPCRLPAMQDTGREAAWFYRSLMANEIQVRFNNDLGRMIVSGQANEYRNTLRMNWVNPVFAVQNAFNQIAGTEINNYHQYLAAAENYATKRRYHLYDYALNGRDFRLEDYRKLPEFDFRMPEVTPWKALWLVLPVLLLIFVLPVLATLVNRKGRYS